MDGCVVGAAVLSAVQGENAHHLSRFARFPQRIEEKQGSALSALCCFGLDSLLLLLLLLHGGMQLKTAELNAPAPCFRRLPLACLLAALEEVQKPLQSTKISRGGRMAAVGVDGEKTTRTKTANNKTMVLLGKGLPFPVSRGGRANDARGEKKQMSWRVRGEQRSRMEAIGVCCCRLRAGAVRRTKRRAAV
ncbi:hypothetical protein LZ30DRAFT_483987 [Colletotrichum cereale]|nr:hypothetical protein LZ30DRAFT_483987 [Colletotrichum cereale]